MADDAGKTEEPTPKRLRDAQKEGQFPRTPDASTWAGIAAATAVVPLAADWTEDRFRELFARIPDVVADPSPARAFAMLSEVPMAIAAGAGPVCAAAALASLAAAAAQGVHPSGKALKPKFSRMNPGQGIKRMFGPKAAWEGLKALLKVVIIGAVIAVLGRDLVPELAGAGALPLGASVERIRDGFLTTVWAAVLAGVFIAAADYAYQRRQVMKQLKMSMFEIKQEHKQSEGDPQVKAAIRQKQMAMSRNRMLANVATADVVLVNPTHLAVALKYQVGAGAPRVVAKGAGAIALKIRERAQEARVPVVEDKPLCRVIYRSVELEEEIPAELYAAVARVLAFVMAAGRPRPTDGARRPTTTVPVPEVPSRAELRSRRAKEIRAARGTR
jgi:flagellar biosynthetic protein FlhB